MKVRFITIIMFPPTALILLILLFSCAAEPVVKTTITPYTNLVWSDEFNTIGSIDSANWSFETGNGGWGWGNGELEYYQTANADVVDDGGGTNNGMLVITAKKEVVSAGYTYQFTSARMKTQGKRFWDHGTVAARLQLPYGYGIWPAFWMLGENITTVGWPTCGEIDIMELKGGVDDSLCLSTSHYNNNGHVGKGSAISIDGPQNWHIFEMTMTGRNIGYALDGKYFFIHDTTSSTTTFTGKNFFILLNLAIGGQFFGDTNITKEQSANPESHITATFPQKLKVDWVRVYQ